MKEIVNRIMQFSANILRMKRYKNLVIEILHQIKFVPLHESSFFSEENGCDADMKYKEFSCT
jgi:hypothetical protein